MEVSRFGFERIFLWPSQMSLLATIMCGGDNKTKGNTRKTHLMFLVDTKPHIHVGTSSLNEGKTCSECKRQKSLNLTAQKKKNKIKCIIYCVVYNNICIYE